MKRDRHVIRELADGEQRPEVVGDRVKAAGVHEPRTALPGGGVVAQVHQVDELRFAGQIGVVGAGRRARRNKRLSVLKVWADRGDHNPRCLCQRLDRCQIRHVGREYAQVRALQFVLERLELRDVAPGDRDPRALGGVLRQVLGRQFADISGRAEQDDVVHALHCSRLYPDH